MAAKKKTSKKKSTKKKGTKKKSARKAFEDSLKSLQKQLPAGAAKRVGELRKNVKELERRVDKARADAEKRFHKVETDMRQDAAKTLRRLEKMIQPKKKKKSTRKKKSSASKA